MRALGRGWAALALLAAPAGNPFAGEEAPRERAVDLGGGVKMTFVLIPSGTFTMGSMECDAKALHARWPEAEPDSRVNYGGFRLALASRKDSPQWIWA